MPRTKTSPKAPKRISWLLPRLRARIAAWPWFWRWLARLSVACALLGATTHLILGYIAGKYDLADLNRMPERSIVYDNQGREIGRLHGENRIVIRLSEVPKFFQEALLAREDNGFYDHGGISWRGIARAAFRRVADGARQGASTITMQLANNSFRLGKRESLFRKLVEIALTRRIESNFEKNQILEMYVNRIFFGTGFYGIERAAQAYFGKCSRDMSPDECALLVAIIRGPNKFSPFRNYEVAISGRNMVLDRMVFFKRLSAEEAERIKNIKTKVLPQPKAPRESWVMDSVGRELTRILDSEDVDEGGLKIFTTLDPALQKHAEQAVIKEMAAIERKSGYEHPLMSQFDERHKREPAAEPDYLQGAAVVIDNATGAILSTVGGRNIDHSSFNRAALSKRQAGSTFKPFVFAAAVERGLLPGTLVNDGPIKLGDITSASDPEYSPVNSDKSFNGLQRADWGLAKSRNTVAVRAGEFAGLEAVKDIAARVGFGEIKSDSAQLYLGNTGITLEALTSAFSSFPNAGVRCRPFLIDRIEDNTGVLVFRSGVMDTEAMRPGAAWVTAKMLERVCAPGGMASEVATAGLSGPVGGKTGTAEDYRDAWFVGFNPRITCGVWVGLDDPERIIHRDYGSRLALPVWIGIMRRAQSLGYRGSEWARPALREVEICGASGWVAGPACRGVRIRETLPEDIIPAGSCPVHTLVQPDSIPDPTLPDRLRKVAR